MVYYYLSSDEGENIRIQVDLKIKKVFDNLLDI